MFDKIIENVMKTNNKTETPQTPLIESTNENEDTPDEVLYNSTNKCEKEETEIEHKKNHYLIVFLKK